MGVLEQVTALKGKGLSDQDISKKLKEQGVSPKEINNALSQAKIKEAVSSEGTNATDSGKGTPSMMGPGEGKSESLPTEGSLSDEDLAPPSPSGTQGFQKRTGPMHKEVSENQQEYVPGAGEYGPQPMPQSQVQEQGEYPQYPYQQQYPAGNYPQGYAGGYEGGEYGYGADYAGYAPGAGDTDTMIEIAEQVFSEKTKTIQKQIEDLNEFKALMQTKIDNLSDRLKRIESNIDSLQSEILEEVGSYGRGIEGVKKEMSMMQDSFGKVVNTLADKAEEKKHKPTHHKIEKKVIVTHKPSKKKKRKKRSKKKKKK